MLSVAGLQLAVVVLSSAPLGPDVGSTPSMSFADSFLVCILRVEEFSSSDSIFIAMGPHFWGCQYICLTTEISGFWMLALGSEGFGA